MGTGLLRCDLCDRESDPDARGWRADHTLDASERPAVQVLCAECAGDLVWLGRSVASPEPDQHGRDTELRLRELERRERTLSGRRRGLHRAIDHVQGTPAAVLEAVELLAVLAVEERDISDRRRALHLMIDRLRGD